MVMESKTQLLEKRESFKREGNKDKRNKSKKKKVMRERRRGEKEYKLLSYEELPEYMKENDYILRHYRAEWPLRRAAFSLFSWHNETINVWTHLVGFLVFLGLTVVHLKDVPQVADLLWHFSWPFPSVVAVKNSSFNQGNIFKGDVSLILNTASNLNISNTSSSSKASRWPFFVFLAGSMFCLLSSSMCHLFCCHSHRLNLFLARFDYVGIAIMIVTSFFPPIYYIFQCDTHWQLVYLTGITAMGIVTVITLLSPHLATGKFRAYRALLFSIMGFSGIVPAIHATIVNWNDPKRPITLAYEIAMASSYVTGTLFYVSRIPEKWKPGMFDLTGHSHQIFHVFVIAGALAHYGAALIFLEYRDSKGCY